ncbi:MAG: glycoside hydrolase family 3 N-terminal domain-containing protein [Bacteroidota bacterium]
MLDSLTTYTPLDQKIGQLFMISAYGRFENGRGESYQRIAQLIEAYNVGGIMFFRGDVYGQAALTNKFQRLSKIPLWISQDMEFGAAMRVEGSTRFTPAMGIAATDNAENAYLMGKITAKEAKALGVHQMYAPVLDVNNNPDNPTINVRAFSGDPQKVAEFGAAFIRGAQSEGVIATAKHFPGHGDTGFDSHASMPIVNYGMDRLDTLELIPFRAAIQENIGSMMSAHVAFPKIGDGKTRVPGTLDNSVLNNLLIDSLNFNGLVVTDGLQMRAITAHFSPGKAAIKALEAGADIMLISPDVGSAIQDIELAVQNGTLSEERINRSFRKIMELKYRSGLLLGKKEVDLDKLNLEVHSEKHKAIADRIARESVTILKNNNRILPIDPKKYPKIALIALTDEVNEEEGLHFARNLRTYHPSVKRYVYDKRSSSGDLSYIVQRAEAADLIIVSSHIHLRTGKQLQFSSSQQQFLNRLFKLEKPTALISFGNPYLLKTTGKADVHVLAWYNTYQQMDAVAPALFGASTSRGRLPIDIPGGYTAGDGITIEQQQLRPGHPEDVGVNSSKLFEIDRTIEQAIRDSVFPGATVGVIKDGVLIYEKAFGYYDYDKRFRVREQSLYDLASVTKVLGTTTLIMRLIDQKKLSLDDRISIYLPAFDIPEKKDITIRDLLLHQSGLPPYIAPKSTSRSKEAILSQVASVQLAYPPRSKFAYSDLGFIILGQVIEQVTNQSLEEVLETEIARPLSLTSTFANPYQKGQQILNRVAPTEIDRQYKRGRIHGRVHDELAYRMDGLAGHAGLFSTVSDVAQWVYMLMNKGYIHGSSYINPETLAQFTSNQSGFVPRGLGFDLKSSEYSTAGDLASASAFGQLGFTGTSIWVDPDKNMAVVLLTNRTWPSRTYGNEINTIRAQINNAAWSAMDEN